MADDTDGRPTDGGDGDGIDARLRSRLSPYLAQYEAASAKLAEGDYHAEDLLDDWFRFVGRMAKDMTAATAMLMESFSMTIPDEPEPSDD